MSKQDFQQALKIGLIGEHEKLYQTDASFKTAVDMIASMLPTWIDGLAKGADAQKRIMDACKEYDMLIGKPVPFIFFPGWKLNYSVYQPNSFNISGAEGSL